VDETYVKVAGRWSYLYRAVDQHGQVVDVFVSMRRDAAAARVFFTRALRYARVPVEVMTDRAPAYPPTTPSRSTCRSRIESASRSTTLPCLSDRGARRLPRSRMFEPGLTQQRRIKQPIGRAGSALDNAAIESWHSTLEFELRDLERFATKAQARTRVAAWSDEYNRDRKHSSIGMRSPIDYELTLRDAEQPHTQKEVAA
jgi:transposase-like protein